MTLMAAASVTVTLTLAALGRRDERQPDVLAPAPGSGAVRCYPKATES